MNRKIIWVIVLVLLIIVCAIWSSFKIETFSDYDFYSSELKNNYKDILKSKYSSANKSDEESSEYIPRLINNNNLQNTSQTNFLDNMTDKMDNIELKLMGIVEKPKYYSENESGKVTKNDPMGILRPIKETIKSNEHYEY